MTTGPTMCLGGGRPHRLTIAGAVAAIAMSLIAAPSANAASNKFRFTESFGRQVNRTAVEKNAGAALEDHCTAEEVEKLGVVCQRGTESAIGGGFAFPHSVAVDPAMQIAYVTDSANNRIEEFTLNGEFLLTFGWNVNRTKVEQSAPQEERNVCTAASKDECQAGERGTGASEQIWIPQDIAVEPTSHNLYILDVFYKRIDEYTPQGRLVLMMGGNVNKTKVAQNASEEERDLCTAASGEECGPGEFSATGGALKNYPELGAGNLLAFGGPPAERLLYVGDEARVQEFEPDGKYKRPLPLPSVPSNSLVTSLAVDEAGVIYVSVQASTNGVKEGGAFIHEYDANGKELFEFSTKSAVFALARDHFGRFVVAEAAATYDTLYSASGAPLSVFASPGGTMSADGFAVTGEEEQTERVYTAVGDSHEVDVYEPVPVLELKTGSATCSQGPAIDSSVTYDCVAHGEADPKGVASTTVWFEYGTAQPMMQRTPAAALAATSGFAPIEATLEGLRPAEKYYFTPAGEDENTEGIPVRGDHVESLETPPVPPRIACAQPEAFYVTFSSADLACSVNPENLNTVYRFQYAAACESLSECADVHETELLESATYGAVGVMQSVTELKPSTIYRYRLIAENSAKQVSAGQEGQFMTPPAPNPTATTGLPAGLTPTTATLTGSVDPDGAAATYFFQLGLYNGASTVYGTVASGATGSQAEAVAESFAASGLQAGATYAYRLAVYNAYTNGGQGPVYGQPVVFTTPGLPSAVLSPPIVTQLPTPAVAFPVTPSAAKRSTGKKRAKHAHHRRARRHPKARSKK